MPVKGSACMHIGGVQKFTTASKSCLWGHTSCLELLTVVSLSYERENTASIFQSAEVKNLPADIKEKEVNTIRLTRAMWTCANFPQSFAGTNHLQVKYIFSKYGVVQAADAGGPRASTEACFLAIYCIPITIRIPQGADASLFVGRKQTFLGNLLTFLRYVSFPSRTKVSGKSLFRSRETNLSRNFYWGFCT